MALGEERSVRTMSLTSSTLSSPPAAVEPERGYVVDSPGGGEVAESEFDGLTWTHRASAGSLLGAVPAAVWSSPEAQGWRRVKHNARRDVWRAEVGGGVYYLKYYFPDSLWRSLVRPFRAPACIEEWRCGLYAEEGGIPAARPLAYSASVRRGAAFCALLVTVGVEHASPLDEFWLRLQSDDEQSRRVADREQVTELLAEMIARAHQAGFEHVDMHAANILVQTLAPRRYRTVLVDLQSARCDAALSDRAVVRNLAQLNQWFRKNSGIGVRLRFLRAYLRWRNECEQSCAHGRPLGMTFAQLVAALRDAAQRQAQRLGAQRDRRAFRSGRYFLRIKVAGGWRGMAVVRCKRPLPESRASTLIFARHWWREQLARPLHWFDDESSQACKESHSGAVRRALLQHDGKYLPVIIKRPQPRNWRRRLSQIWGPSRSRRGWGIGHALLHRDLPTARPLAMLERRLGPLVLDSLLITEALPGSCDLESFLQREFEERSPAEWVRLKRRLCELLATQLRRLHERGFRHRDCKASNMLVVTHPELKLLWIDMDGLRLARSQTPRQQLRPLARLDVSLRDLPGLTRTDRVRFLELYLAGFGAAPDAWRALWQPLAAAAGNKLAAKIARREWKLKHYGRE